MAQARNAIAVARGALENESLRKAALTAAAVGVGVHHAPTHVPVSSVSSRGGQISKELAASVCDGLGDIWHTAVMVDKVRNKAATLTAEFDDDFQIVSVDDAMDE